MKPERIIGKCDESGTDNRGCGYDTIRFALLVELFVADGKKAPHCKE